MARAGAGEPEGLWISAASQSRARGRQGRQWTSDPGNLAASTLLRMRDTDPPAPTLALVAAVALQEAVTLAAPDVDVRIKWPNDLVAGEAKLSGILLERAGDALVVGFGVNLMSAPDLPDRPATSVRALCGAAPDPATLLNLLADVFATWVATWRQSGFAPVRARWLMKAHAAGTAIRVRLRDGCDGCDAVDGVFAGLDAQGGLLLRMADRTMTVHAGDVFLI